MENPQMAQADQMAQEDQMVQGDQFVEMQYLVNQSISNIHHNQPIHNSREPHSLPTLSNTQTHHLIQMPYQMAINHSFKSHLFRIIQMYWTKNLLFHSPQRRQALTHLRHSHKTHHINHRINKVQ